METARAITDLAPALALVLAYISVPIMLLSLLIFLVGAQRRQASALEQTAQAQAELVKQLASIAIELRHLGKSQPSKNI
ncbi:hypothetical protein HR45_00805 [Shewanella mangrovi]|uniref:Uncharacterized protein n=1 Tax=Shewanella mangrovi TaxID=1515746 RepID=A0A094JGC0_9GAMM|nr:hypothetical protein [Shewanella mangrovi]KFZ38975.1 hypothetical protein HR45_00805 [Shewanella mangrovi]